MVKIVLKIVSILILGAIGGMVAQIFLVPYLMKIPFLSEFEFVKNLKREIVVNPTQEIIIKETEALEKAVESVEAAVFDLSSPESQACGFSLTSDGQILTRASFLPLGDSIFLAGQETTFRLLKKNLKLDLALIKIETKNLKTTAFADFDKLKLGTSVFLIGLKKSTSLGLVEKVINQGIVKSFSQDLITTNILEKEDLSGCPLFTFEGKFLGLVKINEAGEVSAIPVSKVRSFTGL